MRYFWLLVWLGLSCYVAKCVGVECKYCHKDFVHVGKHEWRCKERLHGNEQQQNLPTVDENINTRGTASNVVVEEVIYVNDPLINAGGNSSDADNHDPNHQCEHSYQCYCGRYFKSLRGLNTHRRSCFVTEQPYLNDLLVINEPLTNVENAEVDNDQPPENIPKVCVKKGLKLPKCHDAQIWKGLGNC